MHDLQAISGGTETRLDPGTRNEGGYALVALMALMAVLIMMSLGVAPSIRQQTLREREIEAIYRGEEVAEAIRLYVKEKRALPSSMDQLLEGLPRGTKKIQILRPSSAIDPLSSSGEWKLVKPNDPQMVEFQREIMLYNNGRLPETSDQFFQPFIIRISGLVDTKTEEAAPGGEDESENNSGPFIGVASRSRRNSVLNYYGIDRHDHWIFTPLFRG